MFEQVHSVVFGPAYNAGLSLVEGTDKQITVWKVPKAAEIIEVWATLDATIGAGTIKLSLLDKGSAGTATGTAIAVASTATARTADVPFALTVSEGTVAKDTYVSLLLENEASGTTITVTSLVVGIEYVMGNPAAEP